MLYVCLMARCGILLMDGDKLPEIVTSGELQIGGITLKYHVLADGQRIIDKKPFDTLIDFLAGGGLITVEDAENIDKFIKGDVDKIKGLA